MLFLGWGGFLVRMWGTFVGDLCINCIVCDKNKSHMHISPHVSVHIYAYQEINKKSQVLFHKTCLHLPQKKGKKNLRKKLINLRVSVSSGTLALELIKHVQCQFSLLYLLYGPLQKCVLTLDDVMLQVQRIYVNKGSRGKGQGSDVARHYKVY